MKKIAILTSGGDAPGMNAAIRAVVRSGLSLGYEMYGVRDGYRGLVENNIYKMGRKSVADKLSDGGTFLGSSRLPEFAEDEVCLKAVKNLNDLGINYLVAIGGDGTYRGALKLAGHGIKVIGLPGTIDNDIVSTKFTIGFDTACNTVVEAIDKIRDTSSSHHRCTIVEVMGRHCGDIALHTGVSGGAEAIITSADNYEIEDVIKIVDDAKANMKRHALIVITENVCDVLQLARVVENKTGFETRATILGHIQRGGTPSAFDRYLASTMGAYAIKLIEQGVNSVCVGSTGNELYHTDINQALSLKPDTNQYFYDIADMLK